MNDDDELLLAVRAMRARVATDRARRLAAETASAMRAADDARGRKAALEAAAASASGLPSMPREQRRLTAGDMHRRFEFAAGARCAADSSDATIHRAELVHARLAEDHEEARREASQRNARHDAVAHEVDRRLRRRQDGRRERGEDEEREGRASVRVAMRSRRTTDAC